MGGAIYSFGNIVVTQSAFIGNMAGPGRGGAFATNAPGDLEVMESSEVNWTEWRKRLK